MSRVTTVRHTTDCFVAAQTLLMVLQVRHPDPHTQAICERVLQQMKAQARLDMRGEEPAVTL